MASFELKRDEVLLGRLYDCGPDQPWIYCAFEELEALDELRPLFQRELDIVEGLGESFDADDWERAYAAIEALGLRLTPLHAGAVIENFVLHVDGDRAWFRVDDPLVPHRDAW